MLTVRRWGNADLSLVTNRTTPAVSALRIASRSTLMPLHPSRLTMRASDLVTAAMCAAQETRACTAAGVEVAEAVGIVAEQEQCGLVPALRDSQRGERRSVRCRH